MTTGRFLPPHLGRRDEPRPSLTIIAAAIIFDALLWGSVIWILFGKAY